MSSGEGLSVTPTRAPGQDTPPQLAGFTSFDGWERIVQRLRAATLGEFEIRRELGRGGMAIVFLAQDLALRRKVAIKLMSPGLLANDEMIRKFREEAVMVAQMSHPNIITIHGVRAVEDLHFFIMKFVEGESLDKVLRDSSTIPIPLARGILFQVGSALSYAHRRGIIHRDVKPANILIDVEGDALVTDFGIAKAVDSENHTKTGSVVGTPAYMSPEQCYALPATWASDQYALGVVAYEIIAGTAPFTGPSFVVMKAHVDEQPPPLRELRPDCPPDLEAAIMRMLAKKPEDRFPSIGQALTALGARPLTEDDPNRIELAALIRKSVPTTSLTPVSPVPNWSRQTSAADAPKEPTPPATAPATAATAPPAPAAVPPPSTAPTAPPAREPSHAAGPEQTTPRESPATHDKPASVPAVTAPPSSAEAPTVLVPSAADAATVRLERPVPPPSSAVAAPAAAEPAIASTPAPAPVAGPSRVRRRGLVAGALVVAAAAVLWFVVMRQSPVVGQVDTRVAAASPTTTPVDSVPVASGPPPTATPPDSSTTAVQPPAQPSSSAAATSVAPTNPSPPAATAASVTDSAASALARATVVKSIVVLPSELTLMVGQTVRPDITLRGADNRPLTGRRVVWVSPNAAVATVDRATGAVTGVSVGTTEVRASSGDARATVVVHVEAPVVLASIAVDQPRRMTVGDNVTLSATVRDSRGNVMPDQVVSWTSADPGVATVGASSGVVAAIGPGAADITASTGGKATTVRVTVVAPPPPPAATPKTPPPDPAAEERRAREAIESAVQRYVAILRAHDGRTVTSLYLPQSEQDRKNHQALMRVLDGSAKLTAGDAQLGQIRVDGANGVADFSVPMSWRNAFGRIKQETVGFRAELQRDGSAWRVVSARVSGMLSP